jgi:hypothetical protein
VIVLRFEGVFEGKKEHILIMGGFENMAKMKMSEKIAME